MPRKSTKGRMTRNPAESDGDAGNRMAAWLDTAAKASHLLQLRRARGQLEGIENMIKEDRYCADVIIQITAARAALQSIARSLLNGHLKACHAAAMRNGGASVDEMYQELVDLVSKMAR